MFSSSKTAQETLVEFMLDIVGQALSDVTDCCSAWYLLTLVVIVRHNEMLGKSKPQHVNCLVQLGTECGVRCNSTQKPSLFYPIYVAVQKNYEFFRKLIYDTERYLDADIRFNNKYVRTSNLFPSGFDIVAA